MDRSWKTKLFSDSMFNSIMGMLPPAIKTGLKKTFGIKNISLSNFNQSYVYPNDWLNSRKFYGQYGEDIKLWPLFCNQQSGYFVEVGAMEGVRFSNTYFCELRGWKGICIEPHPDYVNLLKHNRPNSAVLQAAVGREDKEAVDFYANYRGSMSTLDKSLEGFFREHYGSFFGGFKQIKVSLLTLNTILRKEKAPVPIDILSIDTEGTERDVLEGFDIEYYAPRAVIAEISIRREPVEEYFQSHGYILCCSNPSNAIFCKNKEDVEMVRTTNVVGTQVATPHPLDEKLDEKDE